MSKTTKKKENGDNITKFDNKTKSKNSSAALKNVEKKIKKRNKKHKKSKEILPSSNRSADLKNVEKKIKKKNKKRTKSMDKVSPILAKTKMDKSIKQHKQSYSKDSIQQGNDTGRTETTSTDFTRDSYNFNSFNNDNFSPERIVYNKFSHQQPNFNSPRGYDNRDRREFQNSSSYKRQWLPNWHDMQYNNNKFFESYEQNNYQRNYQKDYSINDRTRNWEMSNGNENKTDRFSRWYYKGYHPNEGERNSRWDSNKQSSLVTLLSYKQKEYNPANDYGRFTSEYTKPKHFQSQTRYHKSVSEVSKDKTPDSSTINKPETQVSLTKKVPESEIGIRKDQMQLSQKAGKLIDDILKKKVFDKKISNSNKKEMLTRTTSVETSKSDNNTMSQYGVPSHSNSTGIINRAELMCKYLKESRQVSNHQSNLTHNKNNSGKLNKGMLSGSGKDDNVSKVQTSLNSAGKITDQASNSLSSAKSKQTETNLSSKFSKAKHFLEKERHHRLLKDLEKHKQNSEKFGRESLTKLVNSPRSRKDRMQVSKFLNLYTKQQQKHRPKLKLYNTQKSDLETEDEVHDISFENLPLDVQKQVKQIFANELDGLEGDEELTETDLEIIDKAAFDLGVMEVERNSRYKGDIIFNSDDDDIEVDSEETNPFSKIETHVHTATVPNAVYSSSGSVDSTSSSICTVKGITAVNPVMTNSKELPLSLSDLSTQDRNLETLCGVYNENTGYHNNDSILEKTQGENLQSVDDANNMSQIQNSVEKFMSTDRVKSLISSSCDFNTFESSLSQAASVNESNANGRPAGQYCESAASNFSNVEHLPYPRLIEIKPVSSSPSFNGNHWDMNCIHGNEPQTLVADVNHENSIETGPIENSTKNTITLDTVQNNCLSVPNGNETVNEVTDREHIVVNENEQQSSMTLVYRLSLKEDQIRQTIDEIDTDIINLESLLEKTKLDLQEKNNVKKELLAEEKCLRLQRMQLLKGAIANASCSESNSNSMKDIPSLATSQSNIVNRNDNISSENYVQKTIPQSEVSISPIQNNDIHSTEGNQWINSTVGVGLTPTSKSYPQATVMPFESATGSPINRPENSTCYSDSVASISTNLPLNLGMSNNSNVSAARSHESNITSANILPQNTNIEKKEVKTIVVEPDNSTIDADSTSHSDQTLSVQVESRNTPEAATNLCSPTPILTEKSETKSIFNISTSTDEPSNGATVHYMGSFSLTDKDASLYQLITNTFCPSISQESNVFLEGSNLTPTNEEFEADDDEESSISSSKRRCLSPKRKKNSKKRSSENKNEDSSSENDATVCISPKTKRKSNPSPHAKLVQEYLHAESSTDVELNGMETVKK